MLAACLSGANVAYAQVTLSRLEEDITRGGGYSTPMNSVK